jgi:protein subunit release factor A
MKKREKLFSVTIDDCREEHFTVGGHGGSGKDTSNTGVRLTHPPSGAIGECREERSQLANKRRAFERMGRSIKFRIWAQQTAAQLAGRPSVEELVDEWMQPENLKIEAYTDGRWKPEKS